MTIELTFRTMTIQTGQYLPVQKTPKRRKRKKSKTAGYLIQEIIAEIEK